MLSYGISHGIVTGPTNSTDHPKHNGRSFAFGLYFVTGGVPSLALQVHDYKSHLPLGLKYMSSTSFQQFGAQAARS